MLRLLLKIIVYDSDMFTKCGILSPDDNAQESDDRSIIYPDDNAQQYEDIATYNLDFKSELWEPSYSGIRICYYNWKKDFIIQLIN